MVIFIYDNCIKHMSGGYDPIIKKEMFRYVTIFYYIHEILHDTLELLNDSFENIFSSH